MTSASPRHRRAWVRPLLAIIGILVAILGIVLAMNWTEITETVSWLTVYARQPAAPPAPADTRDGRWQQDVQYLASQLPALHVNAFFKTTKEAFEAEASSLVADVPTLNDTQVAVRIMRLVASIGDAHTTANVQQALGFRTYPLGVTLLDDGPYVLSGTEPYRQAIGARLMQIEGREVAAVLDALRPLIAYDNDSQFKVVSVDYLTTPEILHGLGLIADMEKAQFTFQATTGESFTLELMPLPLNGEVKYISIYENAGVELPLGARSGETYWYTPIPETTAMFFQYNRCREMENRPMAGFVKEMFAEMEAKGLDRLILDLRYNGGGNESVLFPFIEEIKRRPALNTADNFFVLIGRRTFSSALGNALTLNADTNATLIGEPTGGKPNGHGEIKSFALPNAKLQIFYSTRYWYKLRNADPPALEPDRAVQRPLSDYLTGRDSVLQAALE
jgi:hypothetical protein